MPPEELDDRYLSGIWYDGMSGDFCKIQRGAEGVELLNPETSEVYHEISYGDWAESEQYDYYRVPDYAIDDPETTMENFIDDFMSDAQEYPMTQYVALLFANENTQIVQTDDHSWNV